MNLRKFLGLDPTGTAAPGGSSTTDADVAAVRRIVDRLESMPPEEARKMATFAYVLARAAAADFGVSDAETRQIEKILVEQGLTEPQAVLVTEIAKSTARLIGGTEDYIVTREYRELSTPEERLALVRACYLVSAADDTITAGESSVLDEIASELDIESPQVTAIRSEFADRFSALQAMRRAAR
ncbi:MAG TPA: TerB family tellurite resistance protein [Candidatus Limnocylindrales bacterium]